MKNQKNDITDPKLSPINREAIDRLKREDPAEFRRLVLGDWERSPVSIPNQIRKIGNELEALTKEISSFTLRVGEGEEIIAEAERICSDFINEWNNYNPFT